jgi:CRP-like cAMP-binding protein
MPLSGNTAVELFQGISETETQGIARLCTEGKCRKGAIPLHLTHVDLANLIGTTRETVTTR